MDFRAEALDGARGILDRRLQLAAKTLDYDSCAVCVIARG